MDEEKRTTVRWTDSDRALAFLIVKHYCTKLGNKFTAKNGRDVSTSREITRTSDSWNLKIQNYTHAAELLAGKDVKKPHVGGCIKKDPNSPSGWRGEYVDVSTKAKADPDAFIELALSEWKNREIAAELYASFSDWSMHPKSDSINVDSLDPKIAVLKPETLIVKATHTHTDYPNRLVSSLASKPFLILAGGTGTGKTRVAKLIAASIAGVAKVEVVAVGADWTDNRPLLGFRNLLSVGEKTYVAPPPLRIILKALDNPSKPHFLILDEMNLSHVERYFADFLSSMESKEPLKLHDSAVDLSTEDDVLVKGKIDWPRNLFVIGTVNIDETTYMFSPKVLDRAHVIEFKVSWEEIATGLEGAVPSELPALRPEQVDEFMRVSNLGEKALPEEDHELLTEVLEDLHSALEGTRFVFAHRTARECLNFIASAKALAKADIVQARNTIDLIDLAILQKALPKLNGASGTLSKVLEELIKVSDKHDLELCKEKLESMSKQLKADHFVSFIQ